MPVVHLTAQFLKGIKPPSSGRVEYWDAATPGLCLRLVASGRASWSLRYRPRESGKKNERITFGSLDELTLADARERAAKVRAQVVDGGNPQLTRRQRRDEARRIVTVDMLAERYVDDIKRRKSSWKDDEQRLVRPRRKLGDQNIAALRRRDIIHFLEDVKKEAPIQANRVQSVLSTMFNWAVEQELLDINPIAGLRKRSKETPSTRTLIDPEIRVLWNALSTTALTTREIAEALQVLLLTGQRPSQIAGLVQSEALELESARSARIEFPALRMKKRRLHVLPLAPLARQIINAAIERRKADRDTIAVFASRLLRRDTLARNSLSQALARVVAKLEPAGRDKAAVETLQAEPPTPHDLRRTVITGMAALGVPRDYRKAVVAHIETDVHGSVYDKYERLREKRLALEKWERHVLAILEPGGTASIVETRMTSP